MCCSLELVAQSRRSKRGKATADCSTNTGILGEGIVFLFPPKFHNLVPGGTHKSKVIAS